MKSLNLFHGKQTDCIGHDYDHGNFAWGMHEYDLLAYDIGAPKCNRKIRIDSQFFPLDHVKRHMNGQGVTKAENWNLH